MRTRNAITTFVALAYLVTAIGLFFHSHARDHADRDGMSFADVHASTTCSLCQATPQSSTNVDHRVAAFEEPRHTTLGNVSAVLISHSIDFARQFRLAPKNSPPA